MLGEGGGLLQPSPCQQADGQEPQDVLGVQRQHRLPLHHCAHAAWGGGQVGLGRQVWGLRAPLAVRGAEGCGHWSEPCPSRLCPGGCRRWSAERGAAAGQEGAVGSSSSAVLQGDEHAGGQRGLQLHARSCGGAGRRQPCQRPNGAQLGESGRALQPWGPVRVVGWALGGAPRGGGVAAAVLQEPSGSWHRGRGSPASPVCSRVVCWGGGAGSGVLSGGAPWLCGLQRL